MCVADVLEAGRDGGVGACAGGAVCMHWLPLGFSPNLLPLEISTSSFLKVLRTRDKQHHVDCYKRILAMGSTSLSSEELLKEFLYCDFKCIIMSTLSLLCTLFVSFCCCKCFGDGGRGHS